MTTKHVAEGGDNPFHDKSVIDITDVCMLGFPGVIRKSSHWTAAKDWFVNRKTRQTALNLQTDKKLCFASMKQTHYRGSRCIQWYVNNDRCCSRSLACTIFHLLGLDNLPTLHIQQILLHDTKRGSLCGADDKGKNAKETGND